MTTGSTQAMFGGNLFLSHSYCYTVTASCLNGANANNGNIYGVTDNLNPNFTQLYGYDSLNRLTAFATGNASQSYHMDSFGNMSVNGVNLFDPATNRISNLPCASSMPGGNAYDAAGNQLCDTDPVSGAIRIYAYDAESRVQSISMLNTNTPFETYGYRPDGSRAFKKSADGNFTDYYTFAGQIVSERLDLSNTWTDYVYANGQRIARVVPSTVAAQLSGNRTDASQTGNVWDVYVLPLPAQPYTVKTGDVLGFRMFQHNAVGAISLGFTDGSNSNWYCGLDQRGDCLTGESTSDQWVNRVVSLNGPMVGKTINYNFLVDNYGPAGLFNVMVSDMTITSADGTVTTLVGPQASGSVASNTYGCASVNSATPWPVTCVTGQVPGTAGIDMGASVASYFMLGDHLGTAQMEFSAGGWPVWHGQFMPFGGELDTQATANHYKFTGKERDTESGNDYFGARYYASSMGRFSSPDPGWFLAASLDNPQTWNQYSYALNNPLKYTDPTGMYCYYGSTDADSNDASQYDMHSTQGECTATDENGNKGQWFDDPTTSVNVDGSTGDVDTSSVFTGNTGNQANVSTQKSHNRGGCHTGLSGGVTVGADGGAGLGVIGASGMAGAQAGIALGGKHYVDGIAAASAGVAANVGNHSVGAPNQSNGSIAVGGGGAVGAGLFLSNATSADQIKGSALTIGAGVDVGVGLGGQLTIGEDASGHTIWQISLTGGLGYKVYGYGLTTQTVAAGTGGDCK